MSRVYLAMDHYDNYDLEMGDYMLSYNQKNWTRRYILYITKAIFEKLNHMPIILRGLFFISSYNPDIFSEYECIIISVFSSCLMNLIVYSIKSIFMWIIRK